MLYLYLASIIVSYKVIKNNIINFENKLKEKDLNTKENINDKNIKYITLFIFSCIPVFNIILSFIALVKEDALYNTYKEAQCLTMLQDNEDLLNEYSKACNLKTDRKRRLLEKQISLIN